MPRIPIAGPWITQKEVSYVTDAAAHSWYEQAGDYIDRFEDAFASHTLRRFAISLPSCTSAIHLSLVALGVEPGDEVIVPDITWIASAAPISYMGATPVFADVDPLTWCLSAESFESRITSRTRAVIPVGLYGGMPDFDAILAVAEGHGIAVIEDAAEAVGSTYRGRPAGSFGDVSVFSFHGSKTLTTGEGGIAVTNDENLYNRMLVLRDHGRLPGDTTFRNQEVAYKYKMSATQAALGLAQLERIDELVERKRTIFKWYEERLRGRSMITLNAEPAGVVNSYWMTTGIFHESLGMRKEDLGAGLAHAGVDTRPFFHPLSSLPAYAGLPSARGAAEYNVVSYRLSPWGINFPSALKLEESDVDGVVSALLGILERAA